MRRFPGEHVSRIHARSCLDSPLDSQKGFTLVEFCILIGFLVISGMNRGRGERMGGSGPCISHVLGYTLPTRVIDEVHVASAIEAYSQQCGSDASSGAPEYKGCKVHAAWEKWAHIRCSLLVASQVKTQT